MNPSKKRSNWHPVSKLIEKYMAPYLDTCADIHLESIKELKKANTQFQKVYEIAKKYNSNQELLKDIIKDNYDISEYVNKFDYCKDYYDEEDVCSILDDVERHLKFFNYNVSLNPKENRVFNNSLERIIEIKEQYKNKKNDYINQIKKAFSPTNLWYLIRTKLVKIPKDELSIIEKILDNNPIDTETAYSKANQLGINAFTTNLAEFLQTAYFLRMMIAIASESIKSNNDEKEKDLPVYDRKRVEDCEGLVFWINENIGESVLQITNWRVSKCKSKRIIVDTGATERYKYIDGKIDIFDIEKRFCHIKSMFIRWLVCLYDNSYYVKSAFLNFPKETKYKILGFARVCPHCRHLIFDYDDRKLYCDKNMIPKN